MLKPKLSKNNKLKQKAAVPNLTKGAGKPAPLEVFTKPTAAFTPHQQVKSKSTEEVGKGKKGQAMPTGPQVLQFGAGFTQALAREIVKNLTTIGQITTRPFRRREGNGKKKEQIGEHPVLVDTSVLIDGRIFPIVNSGFFAGTILIPQFVLREVQHIADSPESIRRTKGRRGLDVVNKLKGQKVNPLVKTKVINEDSPDVAEVDHKLVAIAKKWKTRLLTVDFNLAHLARAQGVKVINVNDMAQALKVALVPGEELTLRVTHEGREREQGVGYLTDGTMVVVDHAKDKVGWDTAVIVTKVHQTPAGQLFFARLK